MKKIYKYLITFAFLGLLLTPMFALQVSAQSDDLFGTNYIEGEVELSDADPRTIVANVINVALGFLGVIAVGIILMGGFKWMTAGGNEDKVSEAKKMLGAGVIGLAIILAAWAISSFILTQLYGATYGV